MASYIRLLNFTQKGIEALKDQATNFSAVKDVVEENGGTLVTAWVCQGRYDIIAIIDAPNDETMETIALRTKEMGLYVGETLSGMPIDEFMRIFGSSPQASMFVEKWFRAGRRQSRGLRR